MSLWQYTPPTKTANTSDEAMLITFFVDSGVLTAQLVVKHTDETTWSDSVAVADVHDVAVPIAPVALLKRLRDAILAKRYTDVDPMP